jgi:hypothetical protein
MSSIEKWSPEYKHLLTKKLSKEGITINCINCVNFLKDQEICTVASIRPPAHVIAHGCLTWEEDLPF